MRLPDDFEEENKGLTPVILTAIVAVTLFVAVILVFVLLLNQRKASNRGENRESSFSAESTGMSYPDTDQLISGSSLSPDDFDFWDKYPEETGEKPKQPSETKKEVEVPEENDPAKDGKHTLVTNRKGEDEWVLISPYLPKHEYDFSKLVCQSNLMKYYENGRQVSYVGADLSKYQDYVDFQKLENAGVDYVMLRIGVRGYGSGEIVLDDYYSDNLKRATDAGLEVGVYFSSQAITVEEAKEEAQTVLEELKEVKITYPVAFDMEFVQNDTARIEKLTKAEKTEIAKTFLDEISKEGYKTVLYGDKEWLIKEVDLSKLTGYDIWLSQLSDIPDYPYRFTMWQYTKTATIDGIAGYANLNISFIDYSEK